MAAASNELLRKRMYAEGATDEEIAHAEGHSYRQIIWAWRERRGLPAHRKPGNPRGNRRKRDAPAPVQEPNGHGPRGRPRHHRRLVRAGFWRDHLKEIGAIARGEVMLVYTPVGTWQKLGRLQERA